MGSTLTLYSVSIMQEQVLDGLLQLFAVVAAQDGLDPAERLVVQRYLTQQVGDSEAKVYLQRFDAILERTASLRLEDICPELNRELTLEQRLFLLIRLVELVQADNHISAEERSTLVRLCAELKFRPQVLHTLQALTEADGMALLLDRNAAPVYLISGQADDRLPAAEQRVVPHFAGELWVVWLAQEELLVCQARGTSDLLLNGQPMAQGTVQILAPGSVLRAPHADAVYYSDLLAHFLHDPDAVGLSFVVENLTYIFPNGKTGLQPIHLDERGGRLIALMGQSGAGKSTLLNVLNGSLKPTTGRVLLNGVDIHKDARQVEGLIGYVPQDELLIEELTVYDNLYFAAQLSLAHLTPAELDRRVMETLAELGLTETARLRVGSPLDKKISGGQRKRLNIALELIRKPQVLFVDEPTSGLSSSDSAQVMDLLKELAVRGRLVFAVIHQPASDIYRMFDRLVLLDKGGYPIFYGHPVEGLRYFRHALKHVRAEAVECGECGTLHPEQLFQLVEGRILNERGQPTEKRKTSPQEWNDRYHFHRRVTETIEEEVEDKGLPPVPPKPGPWAQFRVFLWRDLKAKLANPTYLVVNLGAAPFLGLSLSYLLRYTHPDEAERIGYTLLENDNLPVYLFIAVMVLLFMGLVGSAEELLRDRKVRRREQFLHLNEDSYLLAKVVVLFGFVAVQTVLFLALSMPVLGLNELYGWYAAILFATGAFAVLLGLNLSSAFPSAVAVYVLIPVILIPQMILSGAVVRFDKMNPSLAGPESVPLVANLMTSRWAYEALAVVQYTRNAYHAPLHDAEARLSEARYRLDYWLPELENRLATVRLKDATPDQRAPALRVLRNELRTILEKFDDVSAEGLSDITAPYTEAETARISTLLSDLRAYYRRQMARAQQEADQALLALQANAGLSPAQLGQLKQQHENLRLTDLVRNKESKDKVVERGGRLVRLDDPVFRTSERGITGWQSFLYAHSKQVFGAAVFTPVYNLFILALGTVMLYFSLRYSALKRLLAMRVNWRKFRS